MLGGVGLALAAGADAHGVGVDVASAAGVVGGVALSWAASRPTRRVAPALGTPASAIVVCGVALYLGRLLVVRPALVAVPLVAALGAAVAFLLVSRARAATREPVGSSESPAAREATSIGAAGNPLVGPVVVAVVAAVVYAIWSLERHRRFGSGSWDHGCYLHNAWLFAHGDAFSFTARSSVLGDVAFWGGTNHFMPSLVLTAPLAWLMEWTGSTSLLLVAQAVVVAAAVIPLALLARRADLGPWTTTALATAYLYSVPTQAFVMFDVHEVAPVPLLSLSVLWIVTSRSPSRRFVVLVAALLAVLAGCKESAILYAAALGAWMALFAGGWRVYGVVVVVVMGICFVVVTGVIQPALLEPGGRMIHVARFTPLAPVPASTTEPGLVGVLGAILLHPGRALASLVTPDVKLLTIATSAASFGGLSLGSPHALVLALPNLAERFLSDKREMWGLGFHYGLVGAAALAVGAVDILRRLRSRVVVNTSAFDAAVAVFIVVALGGSQLAAPVAPELSTFYKPYYAADAAVARYHRALSFVEADDAVVAQNHFLPHVALRRHVWLPEPRFIDRADVVILDPRASPWPHDRRHVERLLDDLQHDQRFTAVFHEASTWVFRRR
jgi:uncharacterized membrane protein